MRLLEIVLLVLLVITSVALWRRSPRWRRFWDASLVVILWHLWREGWRWQMVPAYLAFLMMPLLPRLDGWRRGGGVLFLCLLVASSIFVGWAFPVPRMPAPQGPFAIGTITLHLVDSSRSEQYTDQPDDVRELMVQVWYPAEAVNLSPVPWSEEIDILAPELGRWTGLPGWSYSHLRLVTSHALPEAPFAEAAAPAPVLLYLHGWGGFRTIHANLMEKLASYGYVVVAADHTYGAMATRFPDGRVALNEPRALPEDAPRDEYLQAARRLVGTYAADARFILDQMSMWNTSDLPIAGRLDLDRIGVIGHSTGGGAAVELCLQDRRCRALVAYDAWVESLPPELLASGLTVPSLFMRSEPWIVHNNAPNLSLLYAANHPPTFLVTVLGAHHRDFTMLPLFSPLAARLGLRGEIPADEMLLLTDTYTLALFEMAFRGQSSPLLRGEIQPFPLVRLEGRWP